MKNKTLDIIGKKNLYFALSLIVVAPGLIALLLFGLNLSIDFTGGSRLTISFPQKVEKTTSEKIKNILVKENLKVSTVEISGKSILIRTSPINQEQNTKFISTLSKEFKTAKETQFETIGPTIGAETTANAIKAVLLASVLIILYITWSFRKVPKPASSLRFGVSTIVVFDRIRENLRKSQGSFPQIVNYSILQTLDRSLNTSLTVLLVLFALLLFGGETIKWFVVALLIGVTSGTYSSIFNASPILVVC